QVMPARLAARKPSGGAVELLLVRRADPDAGMARGGAAWTESWEVLARGLGTLAVGSVLTLEGGVAAAIEARGERGAARVRFTGPGGEGLLAYAGKVG